jgi:hypothetical protein
MKRKTGWPRLSADQPVVHTRVERGPENRQHEGRQLPQAGIGELALLPEFFVLDFFFVDRFLRADFLVDFFFGDFFEAFLAAFFFAAIGCGSFPLAPDTVLRPSPGALPTGERQHLSAIVPKDRRRRQGESGETPLRSATNWLSKA